MCFDPATKKTSYQRFILQFALEIDIVLVNERNIKLNEISFFSQNKININNSKLFKIFLKGFKPSLTSFYLNELFTKQIILMNDFTEQTFS